MATLRELIIKISANSSSFQNEISRASRMGNDYYKTMQNGGRQAAAAARESQRAIAHLNNQLASAKMIAAGFTGAIAGAFTVTSLITAADNWGQLSSRIKMATDSADEYNRVQSRLMEISDRTYKPIEEQGELFVRSATAMKELGYSTESTIDFIDSISSALTINAASAEKGTRAINALSKSMVVGKVSGNEWNTVMEVMPTVIGDVARHLDITETAVKKLAREGKLSMQTFSDAVISAQQRNAQLAEDMPTTVGDAITKLSNHWKKYIGETNNAYGATQVMSDGIGKLADNLDTVANVTGVLIGLGVARYFGNYATSVSTATGKLIEAQKNEVSLAAAKLRGTQIATARARATVYRAQQAVMAAKNTDAQTLAEKRLAAAQASLTRNIAAKTAAQTALNSVTSVGSRLLSSASGLVGGIPGLVMMGAGAWYYMYQQQEQARKSAQEYAAQIDVIREKTSQMSLPELAKNKESAAEALAEQNRLISEQQKVVNGLKADIETLNQARKSSYSSVSGTDTTLAEKNATEKLAIEQARLNELQDKAKNIVQALEENERRRVVLIREQTWRENAAYQSLVMMTGQHAAFNRVLGLGNNLLASRQALITAPLRIPQASVSESEQQALLQKQQAAELAGLKGLARAKKQAEFDLQRMGKTGIENSTYADQYMKAVEDEYTRNQAGKPAGGAGKSELAKTEDIYTRLIKQQREQMALTGQNTELARTKYQIVHGELATLTQVQKNEILRNSAAIDHLNAVEKLRSLNEQLLTPEEALLNITRERIKLLKDAAPASEEYRESMERISKASVQNAPEFEGVAASVGGPSGELIRVANAQKELQKWHEKQLEMQKELLEEKEINEQVYAERIAEINKTNSERLQDIQAGYTSASLSMFSDLAGQTAQLLQGIGQEGSFAYRTLFIASKAAAIAQAIINTELAATKAMAEGGLILGIPAATAIRAVGYASVGLIAGQTLAGMAHDGIDRVPENGTWLLQKGERVVTAGTSAKLDETLEKVQQVRREERESISGGTFTIHNSYTGKPDDATLAAIDRRNEKLVKEIRRDMTKQVISPSNEFGRALQSRYTRGYKE
ncbi:phage tail tape measure protein [Citrobacter braakii]|uniref:phage tail tape measure protein n=1 Tax=Citrobacter braakii TaxID=57706 RepID=UPI0009BB1D9E|nr:phage tail tape measure protein [Citrobacter braakii]